MGFIRVIDRKEAYKVLSENRLENLGLRAGIRLGITDDIYAESLVTFKNILRKKNGHR
jgi:hypothetical protein